MSKEEKKPTDVAVKQATHGERFTAMVIREFGGIAGAIALTPFQKRLVQNYFVSLDLTLKTAEEKRMKKPERFRDPIPFTWDKVNMQQLSLDVVAAARMGYDPSLPNHINMMPFKNNAKTGYDIVFIEGYRGLEIKSHKYGLEIPDSIIVELVYKTDIFKQFKKDEKHPIESYTFEITNDFDRGDLIGGFYYYSFTEHPEKNKLMVYNKAEIEKRKPRYASPEFWGGNKDKWETDDKGNSKVVGQEAVEGWYKEMMWKTVARMAYGGITIDSEKIDEAFMRLSVNVKMANDLLDVDDRSAKTIQDNANKGETIDITSEDVTEKKVNEVKKISNAKAEKIPSAPPVEAELKPSASFSDKGISGPSDGHIEAEPETGRGF